MTEPDVVLLAGPSHCGGKMVLRGLARLADQLHRRGVTAVSRVEVNEGALLTRRALVTMLSDDALLGDDPLTAADSGRMFPTAEERVQQCIAELGGRRVRIVLFIRRQDRLMEFAYLQALHLSRHHDFDTQFSDAANLRFDYGELIRRLRAISGVQDAQVMPIELADRSPAAYVDETLAAVGLRGQLDLRRLASKLRPYRTYSVRGAELARVCAPLTETRRDRRALHRFLIDNFEAHTDADTHFFNPEQRQAVLAAHREVNAALFEQYLPHLPSDSYADDAATDRLGAALSPIDFDRPSGALVGRLRR